MSLQKTTKFVNCYRPQTKVVFLHVSVILSTVGEGVMPACLAGGIPACLAGLQGASQHALQVSRPTPRGSLRGLDGGVSRPTAGGVSQHALRQTPTADGYCCGWYTSCYCCGWYASCWNAFMLIFISCNKCNGCNFYPFQDICHFCVGNLDIANERQASSSCYGTFNSWSLYQLSI